MIGHDARTGRPQLLGGLALMLLGALVSASLLAYAHHEHVRSPELTGMALGLGILLVVAGVISLTRTPVVSLVDGGVEVISALWTRRFLWEEGCRFEIVLRDDHTFGRAAVATVLVPYLISALLFLLVGVGLLDLPLQYGGIFLLTAAVAFLNHLLAPYGPEFVSQGLPDERDVWEHLLVTDCAGRVRGYELCLLAPAERELLIEALRPSARRCPYCRDTLGGRDVTRVCVACNTTLHAACASESGGCTTFGCAGTLERAAG